MCELIGISLPCVQPLGTAQSRAGGKKRADAFGIFFAFSVPCPKQSNQVQTIDSANRLFRLNNARLQSTRSQDMAILGFTHPTGPAVDCWAAAGSLKKEFSVLYHTWHEFWWFTYPAQASQCIPQCFQWLQPLKCQPLESGIYVVSAWYLNIEVKNV